LFPEAPAPAHAHHECASPEASTAGLQAFTCSTATGGPHRGGWRPGAPFGWHGSGASPEGFYNSRRRERGSLSASICWKTECPVFRLSSQPKRDQGAVWPSARRLKPALSSSRGGFSREASPALATAMDVVGGGGSVASWRPAASPPTYGVGSADQNQHGYLSHAGLDQGGGRGAHFSGQGPPWGFTQAGFLAKGR